MKIVIDIPDALYTACQITSKINGKNDVADILIDAVGSGTPLDNILNKIRAEIESITPKAHIRTGKLSIDTELMIPLDRVLKVLDKYKAESEK